MSEIMNGLRTKILSLEKDDFGLTYRILISSLHLLETLEKEAKE